MYTPTHSESYKTQMFKLPVPHGVPSLSQKLLILKFSSFWVITRRQAKNKKQKFLG
jgi:hypothetical protein